VVTVGLAGYFDNIEPKSKLTWHIDMPVGVVFHSILHQPT
jgi:hypothetical protein